MQDRAFTPKLAPAAVKPRISGKAIASLICGLLSFCLLILSALPGFVLGWLAINEIRGSEGRIRGAALAVGGIVLSAVGALLTFALAVLLFVPAFMAAQNAARMTESSRHLRQIGEAVHNYSEVHTTFPLAGSEEQKLGIGLSWRVRILKYLDQEPLYDKFDQNTAWDSPRNMALVEQMPAIFKAPGVNLPKGQTVYLGVLGSFPGQSADWESRRTVFNPSVHATRFADIMDGTTNTIMIVEADVSEAAIWTKPDDWEFDPQAPRRGLGTLRGAGFAALFVDGSARFIPTRVSDESLRRLFLMADGQLPDDFPPRSQTAPKSRPARRH